MTKSSKKLASKSTGDKENAVPDPKAAQTAPEKTEKEIQEEIQAIFRQITASVTFLPQLDGNCTFNVLVYADADSEVPLEWGDSDAKEIKNGEKVQLRGFSTSNHKVDTLVSYRCVLPHHVVSMLINADLGNKWVSGIFDRLWRMDACCCTGKVEHLLNCGAIDVEVH